MSQVLLVAEATPRAVGEFRRPWVRALYRRYLGRYRTALAAAVTNFAAAHQVTVFAGRDGRDRAGLSVAADLRAWEDELLRNEPEALAFLIRELIAEWWPPRDEPGLTFDGVWLPDLLPVTKGILLRLDLMDYVGIVVRALDADVKPGGVVLLTGASTVEHVARALAAERGTPARVAQRSPAARVRAAAGRALRRREERRALAAHVNHRRMPVSTPATPWLFSVSHARHFLVVDPLVRA